jgi:hypothetical protein
MTNTSYVQGPWSLRELFSGLDAPEIQKEVGELEQQVQAFEGLRPRLSPALAEKDFAAALGAYDALLRKLSRLDGFAELSFAENTQDPKVHRCRRGSAAGAERQPNVVFPVVKALDDRRGQRCWRRGRPATLEGCGCRIRSPRRKKVINLKGVNGSAAW